MARRRQQSAHAPERLTQQALSSAEAGASNRLLRDDSRFESGASARPPVELTAGSRGAIGAKAPPPGKVDVEGIANMKDPVARNHAITQGYYALSNQMAGLLGKENANWATFGVWASKQAGVSIRQEDLPKVFMDQLNGDKTWLRALTDIGLATVNPLLPLMTTALKIPIKHALNRVSDAIADGNQKLFRDIAPEFQRFTETFKGDKKYDAAKVAKYLAGFPPGKENLKAAFADYAKAMFEKDPNKKAELMLSANDRVGVHEQKLIQGEVERALNAPIKEAFAPIVKAVIEKVGNTLPFPANTAYLVAKASGLVDKAVDSIVNGLAAKFRQFTTDHMMKLGVPGGSLKLGDDVTPGAQGAFPEHLRTLESSELKQLLSQYDKTPDSLKGSAANDWSKFDQRMNYIVDLFRSRQQDPQLFAAP
ncbi:hypothetical protein [Myxococcus stipitatus]|uniref:hypothetical protein n=1 Tax=Myxococcus stipitatus TaxID=83455 RepID=UPI0011856008|nr:hypothetical protein [Myxococcus stipitatus]